MHSLRVVARSSESRSTAERGKFNGPGNCVGVNSGVDLLTPDGVMLFPDETLLRNDLTMNKCKLSLKY